MLSLLGKILARALGTDGVRWRRSKPVKIAIPREPRLKPIEIKIRKPMSVITRAVGARTATRRRIRFEKAHWEISIPPLVRWSEHRGRWVTR